MTDTHAADPSAHAPDTHGSAAHAGGRETHGSDEHGHDEDTLGPVDTTAWIVGAAGVLVGCIIWLCFVLATLPT